MWVSLGLPTCGKIPKMSACQQLGFPRRIIRRRLLSNRFRGEDCIVQRYSTPPRPRERCRRSPRRNNKTDTMRRAVQHAEQRAADEKAIWMENTIRFRTVLLGQSPECKDQNRSETMTKTKPCEKQSLLLHNKARATHTNSFLVCCAGAAARALSFRWSVGGGDGQRCLQEVLVAPVLRRLPFLPAQSTRFQEKRTHNPLMRRLQELLVTVGLWLRLLLALRCALNFAFVPSSSPLFV